MLKYVNHFITAQQSRDDWGWWNLHTEGKALSFGYFLFNIYSLQNKILNVAIKVGFILIWPNSMAHPTKIPTRLVFLLSFFPANPYLKESKKDKSVTRKIPKHSKKVSKKGI
jgi:hypothetical protein